MFVGNLPFDVQDEDLYSHFSRCGEIEFVRIVRDKKTNIGKGFGYVQFKVFTLWMWLILGARCGG